MAPAFMECDQAVIEPHRGKPIPGAYYIFRFRSRHRSKYQIVRRLSHITPTGRWAMENFTGGNDGGVSVGYYSPKHW